MLAPDYDFAPYEEQYDSYGHSIAEPIASNKQERDYTDSYQDHKDAKTILDSKIYEHQSNLVILISEAKLDIEAKLRFKLFKKNTQGWSIVAAGIKDIFGDYVGNDYEINDLTQIYTYGFLFFYGLGFGLPSLVGNPDPPPINCGVRNYHNMLDKYGLSSDDFDLSSRVRLFSFLKLQFLNIDVSSLYIKLVRKIIFLNDVQK